MIEIYVNVMCISDVDSGEILGYNFFDVFKMLGDLDVNG